MSIKTLEEPDLSRFNKLLQKEQLIVLFYNHEDTKKDKRQKEYSITSTVFELGIFFYTEKEEVYKQSLTLCEEMNNYHEGTDSGLVLIHPDHHRCYFYEGYFDHKKIVKFLSEKEKAFLRPFDHLSLEMHRFYNLPIAILFLEKKHEEEK